MNKGIKTVVKSHLTCVTSWGEFSFELASFKYNLT